MKTRFCYRKHSPQGTYMPSGDVPFRNISPKAKQSKIEHWLSTLSARISSTCASWATPEVYMSAPYHVYLKSSRQPQQWTKGKRFLLEPILSKAMLCPVAMCLLENLLLENLSPQNTNPIQNRIVAEEILCEAFLRLCCMVPPKV